MLLKKHVRFLGGYQSFNLLLVSNKTYEPTQLNQDIFHVLYQKVQTQQRGFGTYMLMLMILTVTQVI